MKKLAASTLLVLVALALACSPIRARERGDRAADGRQEPRADSFLDGVKSESFEIHPLIPSTRYYPASEFTFRSLLPTTFHKRYKYLDEQGVPRDRYLTYNPSVMSFAILNLLSRYELDPDQENRIWYLARARLIAEKLEEISVRTGDVLLFPYQLERTRAGVEYSPPWYSGMGQGLVLGSFSRLYVITGESSYLEVAHAVYRSLLLRSGLHDPWVTTVDDQGYVWIEEYPAQNPFHVFNGFAFAVFGIYDYYLASGDPAAKHLLDACLTTLLHRGREIRIPGDLSSKELLLPANKYRKYHTVHIQQLLVLYHMTRDARFYQQARDLVEDERIYDATIADYVQSGRDFLEALQIVQAIGNTQRGEEALGEARAALSVHERLSVTPESVRKFRNWSRVAWDENLAQLEAGAAAETPNAGAELYRAIELLRAGLEKQRSLLASAPGRETWETRSVLAANADQDRQVFEEILDELRLFVLASGLLQELP